MRSLQEQSIYSTENSRHTQCAHTHTVSLPSFSADRAQTLVMFSGPMAAFIYHGNVHEAVT